MCPIVKSLTPDKGAHGDTIILVGKNFHSDLHSNIVKFNETVVPPSDMITGNTNQLKVRVPLNCGTGPVSVYINDELFSEPGPVFTYEGGKILNVLPLEGSKGDTVTITGEKFAMINNTVKFNGMKAVVTSESDTLIKAIVPKGCGTGLVNITQPNGVVIKGTNQDWGADSVGSQKYLDDQIGPDGKPVVGPDGKPVQEEFRYYKP
ncbi:MAG TPA: IPT/TIG domain-containing protein, partial [Bacteroidia bacterium]|nr:IPT/TIG domain-containing protein [Bacteroidia bacterium]